MKTTKNTKKHSPKGAHISARRWFDGTNTYHSVVVSLSDGTQLMNPFEYGYGDHFFHTAGRLLGIPDPYKAGHRDWQEANAITVDVIDVGRRKDLHNQGRV